MRLGLSRNRGWYIRHRIIRCVMLVLFVILMLFALNLFFNRIQPVYWSKVSAAVQNTAIASINDAVNDYFSEDHITYDDLVHITSSSDGKISSLEANSVEINRIKSRISESIQDTMERNQNEYISIPLGSALKNPVFSALGYKIKVKIYPSSVAQVNIRDELQDAGINQVKHKIYLDISTSVTVVNASSEKTENINTSILIADTIVVGTVPQYYGNGGMYMSADTATK